MSIPNPIIVDAEVILSDLLVDGEVLVDELLIDADMGTFTPVYPPAYTGPTEVAPSEEVQTLETDGLMMESDVTVDAIPDDYVGSAIARQSELSVSGKTVTAPAGYYEEAVSETVVVALQEKSRTIGASGTYEDTPDEGCDGLSKMTTKVPAGSLSVNAETGYATVSGAYKWRFRPITNVGTAGWFQRGNHYGSYANYDAIPTGTTVTPSTSAQTIGGANTMLEGAVTVDAMPTGTEGTPVAAKSAVSNHSVSVTPSVTNTAGYIEGGTRTGTAVSVTASELVSGSETKTSNGTYDVTNLASLKVEVPAPVLETVSKSYTPTTSQQTETVTPGSGYDGISEVDITVGAMPAGSVGNPNVTRSKTSSSYMALVSYPNFSAGYIDSIAQMGVPFYIQTETVTPSTSQQVIAPTSDMYYLDRVTVEAMPSGTAGTPVATKGAVSNHSVEVTPSVTNTTGYITGSTETGTAVSVSASELVSGTYVVDSSGTKDVTNYASASVPAGTAGSPALSVSAVENHAKTIRASVINQTGWITGGTVSGASTRVSAADLVSGSETKTSNGTYDVTNLAELVVNVSGGSPTIQSLSVTPSTSQQTFNASGVDGYKPVVVDAMPSGTEGTPTATKGTVSGHAVTVTPSVTNSAGYISGGTHTGTGVSVSASELVSGTYNVTSSGTKDVTNYASASVPAGTAGTPTATKGAVSNHSVSVTPSVTNQTGFITGSTKTGTAVTVSASELVSGSETKTSNGTYDVTNLAELVVNVSGGGSSKAIYTYQDMAERKANSYGATNATVTVTKAGTYSISYVAVRGSSSGTMGTNLHIGSTTGTNNQTFNRGTYGQYVKLTGQSIAANTAVTIYATSGSTSRYIYVGQLIVEEE